MQACKAEAQSRGRRCCYGCGRVGSGFSAVCGVAGAAGADAGGVAVAVSVVGAGGLAAGTGGVVFLAATFFGAAVVVVVLGGVSVGVVAATTGRGG